MSSDGFEYLRDVFLSGSLGGENANLN